MTTPQRPFLDFYEKHKIIPTTLDITHKQKFFAQRNFLFETLGIPPRLLNGTRILELGPGTGQKAEHLLSLQPAVYVGVDNNLSYKHNYLMLFTNVKNCLKISKSSDFLFCFHAK